MAEREFIAQLIGDLGLSEVRLILAVFNDDIDQLTSRIAQAAEAGNENAFRRAAHALAGAAGAVGASGVEQACRMAMTAPAGCGPQLPAMSRMIRAETRSAAATLTAIMTEFDQSRHGNA
jgi:hypothetical protein